MAQMVGAPPISPDGRWWWDGRQWQSLISPDGRWWWDGQRWQPAETAASAPLETPVPAASVLPAAEPAAPVAPEPAASVLPAAEPAAAVAPEPAAPAAPAAGGAERPSWLATGIRLPTLPGMRAAEPLEATQAVAFAMKPPAMARPKIDVFGLLSDSRVGLVLIVAMAAVVFGGFKLYERVTTITPVLAAADSRIGFKSGAVEKFSLHQDLHGQEVCSCGGTVDTFLSVDGVVRQTVNSVGRDGTAVITIKFDSLTGQFNGRPVAFDAARSAPITLVVSPDGRVISGGNSGTAGGDASDSVPGGDQWSSVLPGREVKPGDNWGKTFVRPNPVGDGVMKYVTNNTFLRWDTLDGDQVAVIQTAYYLPIDMLLDIRQLLALNGQDGSGVPAGASVSYKGNEKGDMTSYLDTVTHEVALAQDASDFDFQLKFQGLPNTAAYSALTKGTFHFTGRQNATLRKVAS